MCTVTHCAIPCDRAMCFRQVCGEHSQELWSSATQARAVCSKIVTATSPLEWLRNSQKNGFHHEDKVPVCAAVWGQRNTSHVTLGVQGTMKGPKWNSASQPLCQWSREFPQQTDELISGSPLTTLSCTSRRKHSCFQETKASGSCSRSTQSH